MENETPSRALAPGGQNPPATAARNRIAVDAGSLPLEQRQALYLGAGRSKNTDAAYSQAIRHFQDTWGGMLPATEGSVLAYLTTYAPALAASTLTLRLAALAKWHKTQGFADPTKGALVKQFLTGIRRVHGNQARQAIPLSFDHLKLMVASLDASYQTARAHGDFAECLRCSRDRALLLLGFWRGFRSNELTHIQVEDVAVYRGGRMDIHVGSSKTDREARGKDFSVPALRAYCPVEAYSRWIEDGAIVSGPVFRSIDQNGVLGESGIDRKSVGLILNRVADRAGIGLHLSTHSMRRGFANWAVDQGWDIKSLMEYVGWKNVENASRYIQARHDFGSLALAQLGASSTASSVPIEAEGGVVLAGEVVSEE